MHDVDDVCGMWVVGLLIIWKGGRELESINDRLLRSARMKLLLSEHQMLSKAELRTRASKRMWEFRPLSTGFRESSSLPLL